MKPILKQSFIFLSAALLFVACSASESTDSSENQALKDQAELEKAQMEKQKRDSINRALSEIHVRIFNHEPLAFDSEGWCIMEDNSVQIKEVKGFNELKKYQCKKGNYIQKLSIEGNFKDLQIQFLDKNEQVVKEFKHLNLSNSISFSDVNYQPVSQQEVKKKDADYQEWFEKAHAIKLSYKDSVFYEATWENNGWFIP